MLCTSPARQSVVALYSEKQQTLVHGITEDRSSKVGSGLWQILWGECFTMHDFVSVLTSQNHHVAKFPQTSNFLRQSAYYNNLHNPTLNNCLSSLSETKITTLWSKQHLFCQCMQLASHVFLKVTCYTTVMSKCRLSKFNWVWVQAPICLHTHAGRSW